MSDRTTLNVKKETLSRLNETLLKLKLHSKDEFLSLVVDGIRKAKWTDLDFRIFSEYGKIPRIVSGTAKDREDLDEQLRKEFSQSKNPPVKGELKEAEER